MSSIVDLKEVKCDPVEDIVEFLREQLAKAEHGRVYSVAAVFLENGTMPLKFYHTDCAPSPVKANEEILAQLVLMQSTITAKIDQWYKASAATE